MGVLKSQIDGVPIYCREGSYLALDVSQQYIMILVLYEEVSLFMVVNNGKRH